MNSLLRELNLAKHVIGRCRNQLREFVAIEERGTDYAKLHGPAVIQAALDAVEDFYERGKET